MKSKGRKKGRRDVTIGRERKVCKITHDQQCGGGNCSVVNELFCRKRFHLCADTAQHQQGSGIHCMCVCVLVIMCLKATNHHSSLYKPVESRVHCKLLIIDAWRVTLRKNKHFKKIFIKWYHNSGCTLTVYMLQLNIIQGANYFPWQNVKSLILYTVCYFLHELKHHWLWGRRTRSECL